MNFKIQESKTKLRGGYYTPEPVAGFLSRWVLHKKPSNILEPSCGDGVFVKAMHGLHRHKLAFTGVELLEAEAEKAKQAAVNNKLLKTNIINTDFLEWALEQIGSGVKYDACVGNPPYIRYQYLEEKDQLLSARIFGMYELPFTKHTNSWVPFVIASIALLNPGGRFAMVIPSELLHVLHATSLRKFLLTECYRILVLDPNELLFDEALQGTVLLMIEKKDSPKQVSQGVAVVSAPNNDFLGEDPEPFFQDAIYTSGDVLNGKWMKVLLAPNELTVFEAARKLNSISRFVDIASVDVGIVTGANKFFLVDNATVKKYALTRFAHPMFGRSDHCPGIIYDSSVHENNQERGLPTNFLKFGNTPLENMSKKAQEYIRMGEEQELHKRYKCRIRTPWYSVPSIYSTQIGMLKRSHNYPRLILNTADAYTTDTAYRIRPINDISAPNFVFNFINSLTALSAELEGRHYGGGVLELVPSEIEKLLVPKLNHTVDDINGLNIKICSNMSADELLSGQDAVVLKKAGLSKNDRVVLHQAYQKIRNRRHRLVVDTPEE